MRWISSDRMPSSLHHAGHAVGHHAEVLAAQQHRAGMPHDRQFLISARLPEVFLTAVEIIDIQVIEPALHIVVEFQERPGHVHRAARMEQRSVGAGDFEKQHLARAIEQARRAGAPCARAPRARRHSRWRSDRRSAAGWRRVRGVDSIRGRSHRDSCRSTSATSSPKRSSSECARM